MSTNDLLSVDQLAKRLGVPVGWVYSRTRVPQTDEIPPFLKLGKYVKFHPEDVETWLSRKRGQREVKDE